MHSVFNNKNFIAEKLWNAEFCSERQKISSGYAISDMTAGSGDKRSAVCFFRVLE